MCHTLQALEDSHIWMALSSHSFLHATNTIEHICYGLNWEPPPAPTSYVEALTLSVTVSGDTGL